MSGFPGVLDLFIFFSSYVNYVQHLLFIGDLGPPAVELRSCGSLVACTVAKTPRRTRKTFCAQS